MTKGSATYYYIYDGLGNVAAVTDGAGQTIQTYDYDAFGNVISTTGTLDNPYQFVGGYGCADDGTGLIYMRARYYMPEIGRFITRDPWEGRIDNPLNLNRYIYVGNNPVNFVDPEGLFYYKPGVPPAGPAVEAGLRCMDTCLGTNLGISGGGEKSGHNPGSKHYTGEAADINFRMNLGLDSKKVMCCAKKCGFGFSLIEGNHYHVQIPKGTGGSRGDLPECGCDK